uniref:Uncharacterized LOC115577316 n=1 Tax=Sparus aurata TaxID=8175 RepID=A0A671TIU6_SPAAU
MRTSWCYTLLCFLLGGSVDSSSSVTQLQSVITRVGNEAVLPCSWKSRLPEVDLPTCHIQWATPVDTVFELRGEQKWEAEEFKGRVEVPEERLGSGDCSLIIRDVQIGDTGRYESFMVVDGARSKKTRVFIQGIKLSVFDHKSLQSRAPGEDLVLDLYTRHSFRVVFQDRNSSQWSDLWMRGDEDSERLEKNPHREQLTMRKLTSSDEGTYKFWMNTASLSAPCSSLWKVRVRPDLQVISTAFGLNKDSNVLVAHGSEFCKCQTTVFKLNWKLRELVERLLSFQILLLCSDPSVPSTLLHLHSCSYIYLPFYLIPVCLDPLLLFGRRFCLQGS